MFRDGRPHTRLERYEWWYKNHMEYHGVSRWPDDWLMHFDRYYNEVNGIVGKNKKKREEKKMDLTRTVSNCGLKLYTNDLDVLSGVTYTLSNPTAATTVSNNYLTPADFWMAHSGLTRANVPSPHWAMVSPEMLGNVECSPKKEKEKVNTMNNAPIENVRIDYLTSRLCGLRVEKGLPFLKTFGLEDDEAPKSSKEMVERIQAGKFVLKQDKSGVFDDYNDCDECDDGYYGILHCIRWRDPSVKKDQAGYDKARADLETQYNATKDLIMVKSADEGLAALQAFASWQPTGAAN